MPPEIDQAAAGHLSLALAAAGRDVTYVRGAQSATLRAIRGRVVFEADTGPGVRENYQAWDWILPLESLVLGGAATLPQAKDQIRETIAGVQHAYTVLDLGSQQPYELDATRTQLRVHTKKTE